mmetsp:Transcript_105155/g.322400  ORF Transcript_105155/g.322400 Transcript_105155/m.322400 type:complete len:217 (-) Transcript_105155:705-1355(-)
MCRVKVSFSNPSAASTSRLFRHASKDCRNARSGDFPTDTWISFKNSSCSSASSRLPSCTRQWMMPYRARTSVSSLDTASWKVASAFVSSPSNICWYPNSVRNLACSGHASADFFAIAAVRARMALLRPARREKSCAQERTSSWFLGSKRSMARTSTCNFSAAASQRDSRESRKSTFSRRASMLSGSCAVILPAASNAWSQSAVIIKVFAFSISAGK